MKKKRCAKCGEVKSTSEFYADRTRKGGLSSYCKDCKKTTWQKWSHTKSGKESLKQYKQSEKGRKVHRRANEKYAKTEKGQKAIRRAQTSPKAKERKRKYYKSQSGRRAMVKAQARWRKNNPEKYMAHKAVHRAIKSGKLASPNNLDCSVCGQKANEYHHPDYSKRLEVTPVCRNCHLMIHA